jgi:hypothetical protein
MRRSQGRYFSQDEINRIKHLLTSTDMTLQEIATRMGCAKSSVVSINQSFQIRDYRGRRSYWVLADSTSESTLQVEAGAISGSPS